MGPIPASPAGSLFASDYSLSPHPSPTQRSPRPPRAPGHGLDPQSYPSSINGKKSPIPIVFPTSTNSKQNFLSPNQMPTPPVISDVFTAAPARIERKKQHQSSSERNSIEEELATVPVLFTDDGPEITTPEIRNEKVKETKKDKSPGFMDCMACMESGMKHETKALTYRVGTEKAYHHLNRANELYHQALVAKPGYPKGMLAKGKIMIQLATNYQPPKVAASSLNEAVKLLRKLVDIAPKSISARETLAQACALLSNILLETEDINADDEKMVWEGKVGSLAREALSNLEDIAADKMDKMRILNPDDAAEQSPMMAEMFLSLSSAAITVSSLSIDLPTVDLHVELAEQALDQASNMATVAAAARIKSSTSSANLITRVQIASGRSSLERLRHTFILGADLDEDDFRSLITDMAMLATECRERAAKLKGSKAAVASSLGWEAIKLLGDAKLAYAALLRLVWRKRKPKRGMNVGSSGIASGSGIRKPSSVYSRGGAGSVDVSPIKEEDEEKDEWARRSSDGSSKSFIAAAAAAMAIKNNSLNSIGSLGSSNSNLGHNKDFGPVLPSHVTASHNNGRSTSLTNSRKGSNLESLSEETEVITFAPPTGPRISNGSTTSGGASSSSSSESPPHVTVISTAHSRRMSWVPAIIGEGYGRSRRASSMSVPLITADGTQSAWQRKASVISLAVEEQKQGMVPSSELANTAWQLLEGAVKQWKLSLTLLSASDLPPVQLARGKAETLQQIAYASLFQASLSQRVAQAAEKRTSLLVTAEVYTTWAAREVGWSFLIEGTRESEIADKRTNSWRADEVGKRSVMLLVRIWWHRAVTTESIDFDTKLAAKDAVETVVRRMKDREGVRDGDVMRWKSWISKVEGELEPAEVLFWKSVSRILRGGAGFVMN